MENVRNPFAAAGAAVTPFTLKGRIDTLLVDADGLCYFCAGNAECTPSQALINVGEKLKAVEAVAGVPATLVATHEDSPKGGRYFLASVKAYQGHRSSGGKPKNWAFLRQRMLATGFGRSLIVETYGEADDRCSAMAGPRVALHSQDKDFRMIPGWHITWKEYDFVYVPPGAYRVEANGLVYGDAWFWLQMLAGDPADNIPGLPKYKGKPVGPVTASKMLAGTRSNWTAALVVYDAYRDCYPDNWQAMILEQAQLLWLRKEPLDDMDVRNRGPFQFLYWEGFENAPDQGQ